MSRKARAGVDGEAVLGLEQAGAADVPEPVGQVRRHGDGGSAVGIAPHHHPAGDALLLLMYERGNDGKAALLWDMEYPRAEPGLYVVLCACDYHTQLGIAD